MSADIPQITSSTQLDPTLACELVEAIDGVPLLRNVDPSISKHLGDALGGLAVNILDVDFLPVSIHEKVRELVKGSRVALQAAGQKVGPLRKHKLKKVFYG